MREYGEIHEVAWYSEERLGELRYMHLGADEEPLFALAGAVAHLDAIQAPQTLGDGALVLTKDRLVAHWYARKGLIGGKYRPKFRDYDLSWIETTAISRTDGRVARLLFREDGGAPYGSTGVQVTLSSPTVREQALPYFGDMLKPLVSAHRGYR